jgi:hypothetical protein
MYNKWYECSDVLYILPQANILKYSIAKITDAIHFFFASLAMIFFSPKTKISPDPKT